MSAGVTQTATTVTGTSGDDTIDCTNAGSAKTIIDYGGNNTITGSAYDDTIIVNGSGNNTVTGGPGNDTISVTGNGNNTLTGSAGDDTITATGTGQNTISYGDQTPSVGTNVLAPATTNGPLTDKAIVPTDPKVPTTVDPKAIVPTDPKVPTTVDPKAIVPTDPKVPTTVTRRRR